MDEPCGEFLSEIVDLWNRIEGRLKLTEQVRQEVNTAAINEMRYAGRRIVDALGACDDNSAAARKERYENLLIAKNYLINADHDVTDGICVFVHKRIKRVTEHHKRGKIERLFPEFYPFLERVDKAQEIIRTARERREERLSEYKNLAQEYVPDAVEFYKKLSSIPELAVPDPTIEKLSILDRHVRIFSWIAVVGSIASIIGLIISLVSWAL